MRRDAAVPMGLAGCQRLVLVFFPLPASCKGQKRCKISISASAGCRVGSGLPCQYWQHPDLGRLSRESILAAVVICMSQAKVELVEASWACTEPGLVKPVRSGGIADGGSGRISSQDVIGRQLQAQTVPFFFLPAQALNLCPGRAHGKVK